MPRQVILEFPTELSEESLQKKEGLRKAKEAFVLELLREGEISQGKAAELLEISRHELFDLMAHYEIPAFQATPKELREGLKNLKEALQ